MRIVQAVIAVVPPTLILWWGGTYVLDAGRLLLAPGVPVAFEYKSPDGLVKLRTESYRIDPNSRTIAVRNVTAKRPIGPVLASVQRIDVGGLDPFNLKPIALVSGVRAHLERDEKGFDLARLIPKQEGPPSKIPYSVTVRDVRVIYVDRTFKRPIVQEAVMDRMVADGVGDDRRYAGAVSLPGVGEAVFRAQQLPNVGVTIDVRSEALRLQRFAPMILPGVSVKSLVAKGPLRFDLPIKQGVKVAAILHAEAQDFRYKQYALDSAVFEGKVSPGGGQGTVVARVGDVRARFEGAATREQGAGQVVATVPSPASLPSWVRKYIPAKVGFRDARYDGWVAWKGTQAQVSGEGQAAHVSYGADSVDAIKSEVAYGPSGVTLRNLTALWQGTPVAGDVFFDPKSRALQAAAVAPKVQLAALSRRFGGPKDLSGFVGGTALVTGTTDRPNVEGSVAGRVALQGRSLGDVEARGAWLGGAARIDRLKVSGPLGAIVAGGTVRPDGTLALKAEARGIRIERIVPDARGIVSANLNVGGTLRDPRATGRLEAYRLAYSDQRLPAAVVDVAADRRSIRLTGLNAIRGTTRLRGQVQTALVGRGVLLQDPKTWPLSGRLALSGVQANEIPGADALGDIAGLLSIPRADLSGRLGNPVLNAGIEGDGLIVRGVRMESLRAQARIDRGGAKLSNLEAIAAGGRVAGSGAFSFSDKSGAVDLQIANLQLSRLLTDVSEDVQVDGTLSAPRVHLAFASGRLQGSSEGTLTGVKVNGVLAGDGNWSLDAKGDTVVAEASVGRLDPTLRALDANATYKIKEGTLDGEVQAKDVPIQAVVAAATSGRSLSEDEATRLATIRGDFSGTVALSRAKGGEISLNATDLSAAAIRYLDIDYGTLTVGSLARKGGRWTLADTALRGAAGNFTLGGWFEESGAIDATATGDAVRLAAFSPFVPDLAQVVGTGRFALTATGMVDRPIVTGSGGVDGLFAASGRDPMSVSIDKLDVRDGNSTVAGMVRYGERFGGLFSLDTNWAYRQPIDTASLMAKLDLGTLTQVDPAATKPTFRIDPVDIEDVPGLNAYLDRGRTKGTLSGSVAVAGTFGHPKLSGGANLLADSIGIVLPGSAGSPIRRIDDPIRDVKIGVAFDEKNAPILTGSARFERGGTVALRGSLADTGNDALETLRATRDWKGLPVTGSVEVTPATIRQTIAGATTTATIEGKANVSGKAVTPKISGAFVLSNVDMNLPSVETGPGSSAVLLFDPSFDLTFALAEAGRFRTATADLYLTGDGSLKGPLSNPVAHADFVTDRGSIRLPGGVVRIQKGGQISFAYRQPLSGGTPASADIDLQGRSQVTLSRPGQGTQRYDITLDMQGDLLRENGLKFDATSDPGDLNRDEILNALGRTDLISSISAGGSSTEANVRNALVGFALPGLLDNFTGGVARTLGLEYLNLEYNEFDKATVAFGSALGPDFSFSGRQQVGTPTPGYRSIYDLRLSYNPRRLLPKLSRLSFTVGVDQDRPWKVSVEYGTRFGGRGGKEMPKHVLFPAVGKP
jgi:hypothetical protein